MNHAYANNSDICGHLRTLCGYTCARIPTVPYDAVRYHADIGIADTPGIAGAIWMSPYIPNASNAILLYIDGKYTVFHEKGTVTKFRLFWQP